MPLEISEDLVSLAYQSLGYFVMEGRKIGRREIDLLAIRLGADGTVVERKHIEVQIGLSPIGVLSGGGKLGTANRDPAASAREWVAKKLDAAPIVQDVSAVFCRQPYTRALVHGTLKDTSQLEVLRGLNIECEHIRALVTRALSPGCAENRLQRAVGIAKLLLDKE